MTAQYMDKLVGSVYEMIANGIAICGYYACMSMNRFWSIWSQ